MIARVVLVFMTMLAMSVDLTRSQKSFMTEDEIQALPDCVDGLIEPRPPLLLNLQYKLKGDAAFEWFCPYYWPLTSIDVYVCPKSTCSRNSASVGTTVTSMDKCRETVSFNNYKRRVFQCMPWEVSPTLRQSISGPLLIDGGLVNNVDNTFLDREKTGMRHLREQFVTFKAVRQWYEASDNVKDQRVGVPKCDVSSDEISFSSKACWHSDGQVVVLKPLYKFKVVQNNDRTSCVLSSTKGTDALYESEDLIYTAQPEQVQKTFTRCKFYGGKIDYENGGLWKYANGEDWNYKDIQFLNYELRKQVPSPTCPDSVSEGCLDNVFSFSATQCVWVQKASKEKPMPLKTMLDFLSAEDEESFRQYAQGGQYVLNPQERRIDAWVNNALWSGNAQQIDTSTASLYFTTKENFSCSGCDMNGQALGPQANVKLCGVPQPCKTCEPWERVDTPSGEWSDCKRSFQIRKCKACEAHHERSTSLEEQADQKCVPCPALTPMRREGQTKCVVCEHTQWFDASSKEGCVYFMSVADGLSFSGSTRFNQAYVDEYKPSASTKRPQVVPQMYYRNLAADANSWNASTSAEMCPPASFGVVNASVAGVAMRNVQGRQVKFRRWCGHAEIIKEDNALVQPLDCGSRRSALPTSLAELVASSAGAYVLLKERKLVGNRMAEIKLTMNDGFSCYYEIRREGRLEDCQYCKGTFYTQGCGPTYQTELDTPAVAGKGTCVACDEQCSLELFPNHFFDVTQFSCWSNGTERVRSDSSFGGLKLIAQAMSASMNYWYKPAACKPCAKLSSGVVPQIVTRCGNKAWFETWNPDPTKEILDEAQVSRPGKRFCCAMDVGTNVGTFCHDTESGLQMTTATPKCEKSVPDLQTEYMNFCPPGWFLDRNAAGCLGVLTEWKNTCCKKCGLCAGSGTIKTYKYKTCSGGTDYDTQLAGCVTTCAEKNYEVNGTCVACESCA